MAGKQDRHGEPAEKGYNLWTGSHQMTRKEELEMYWMEQTAEKKKRLKMKRCKKKRL